MKKRLLSWSVLGLLLLGQPAFSQNLLLPVPSDKPSKAQLKQIERKYGMFIHFGINTFHDEEWTDGSKPAESYAPSQIDAEQWIRSAKDAGMKYVILITKHHDGFCLWDSKYTEYDVASSGNHTDVVEAVAKACKKYGIGLGLYYSLWDRHEPCYQDEDKKVYIQYMKNQLQELMTGYGPVHELWFDGAWDRKTEDWHLQEVYDFVKSMQPDCQISTNWTIGKRPVDMQEGDSIIYFPSDFRLWDPFLPVAVDPKIYTHSGKQYYLPFESTQTISVIGNWFSHPEDTTVRDVEELADIFYTATINDNCLLLNIPPDTQGKQNPKAIENILTLARQLGIENGKPFPKELKKPQSLITDATAEATSIYKNDTLHYGPSYAVDNDVSTSWMSADSLASMTVNLRKESKFQEIFLIIGENSVTQLSIDKEDNGKWVPVYQSGVIPKQRGESFMGYGTISCKLDEPISAQRLQIRILQSNGKPSIYSVRLK